MNKIIIINALLALFSMPATVQAQEKVIEPHGGDKALLDFVDRNMCYPKSAKENGIEGRVIVSFYVETDGRLNNLSITGPVFMLVLSP